MRAILKLCQMIKKKSEPVEPKLTRRKLTDYLPDDHNANVGTERGLQMVEYSLGKVGVGRSIVADKNGKIPAGNKTLEAAINAGFEDVLEIEDDGKTLIIHKRNDWDLDDPTGAAREYAYLDNRAGEEGLAWDADQIARDVERGVDLSHVWTIPELDYVLNPPEIDEVEAGDFDAQDPDAQPSNGELLSLVNITIADPTFQVKHSEVFRLGNHVLICCNVVNEWAQYVPYLEGDNTLFCPYPGPFVPLTLNAEKYQLVMVQPDPYIAGHIVDRWIEQKGKGSVKRG